MLYPVYKNGPFVVIPLSNNLRCEWKELKVEEIEKIIDATEFDFVISSEHPFICAIDVREGGNLYLIENNGVIYIDKSVRRPLKFKLNPYELILFKEPIDSIKSKGRDYIKDLLHNSLFDLLNEKLQKGNINLTLHSAILNDYKNTVNTCVIQ